MANPITWFEIMGDNAAALHSFYGGVFGWKMAPPIAEMGNYSMVDNEHRGIGGGVGGGTGTGSEEKRVTIYIEVDDPQAYLDKAIAAGATLLMPVMTVTEGVTIAMFSDPAGNTMGLLKAN